MFGIPKLLLPLLPDALFQTLREEVEGRLHSQMIRTRTRIRRPMLGNGGSNDSKMSLTGGGACFCELRNVHQFSAEYAKGNGLTSGLSFAGRVSMRARLTSLQ